MTDARSAAVAALRTRCHPDTQRRSEVCQKAELGFKHEQEQNDAVH